MSTMLCKTATTRVAARQGRLSVSCSAVPSEAQAARRAVLLGSILPAVLITAPRALALIPDEEDEELVEKAKANRQRRIAQQKGTTREFMQAEGLTDTRLDSQLVPIQKAIYKLAQSGSQLEGEDLKAVTATLSESWVAEFTAAAQQLGSSSSPSDVVSGIDSLKSAASSGDLKGSKQRFVQLVSAVQTWAEASGLSGSLKGL